MDTYNLDARFIAESQDFRLEDSLEDNSYCAKIAPYIGQYGVYAIFIIAIILLIAIVSDIDCVTRDIIIVFGGTAILGIIAFGAFYKKK